MIFKTEENGNNTEEKLFSSILKLNQYYSSEKSSELLFTYPPLIKYEYFDDNNDGLIDKFKYKIKKKKCC